MKQLSQAAIEAIEEAFPRYEQVYGQNRVSHNGKLKRQGATEALTTPSIYEKASLVMLEDALGFAKFLRQIEVIAIMKEKYLYNKKWNTLEELFTIYKNQK